MSSAPNYSLRLLDGLHTHETAAAASTTLVSVAAAANSSAATDCTSSRMRCDCASEHKTECDALARASRFSAYLVTPRLVARKRCTPDSQGVVHGRLCSDPHALQARARAASPAPRTSTVAGRPLAVL
jgi:hypothetical protein